MLALALTLWLAAPPSPRLAYEAKCLYCHSAELAESRRLTEPGWRQLIEKMRLKAPLLISRSDVPRLARFMTGTLKLTPRAAKAGKAEPGTPLTLDKPIEQPPHDKLPRDKLPPDKLPLDKLPVVEAPDEPASPSLEPSEESSEEQLALEQEAARLIQRRCSKCHTLGRVYGKLDTLERSLTTLERMRLKTGSGITDRDLELLQRYLRSQFSDAN
ncbi:MAG: photosystem P840 reaction-center cytochrome c-551 [Archangium sp.]|nr:photosystem P840 reaction-center cytochrome c-551 [Archangium sp.]